MTGEEKTIIQDRQETNETKQTKSRGELLKDWMARQPKEPSKKWEKTGPKGRGQTGDNEPRQTAFVIKGCAGKIEEITMWDPKQDKPRGEGKTSDQLSHEGENTVL